MTTSARVPPGKVMVMLCIATRGGMTAVVEGYREDGLFERYSVRWLVTYCEGSRWAQLKVAARAYAELVVLLLRGRVAAVHSHMAMRGSFWRKAAFNRTARAFGVPVLAHLHGSEFKAFYDQQSAWRRRFIADEFASCHRVMVLSQSWATFVCAVAPGARVTVLPNYVRMPDLSPATDAADPGVRLLFLGLIGERKGVFDLLPAFAKALSAAPGLKLLIGGNGEEDRARAAAQSSGVSERVEFMGWVSGAMKSQTLKTAHIFILPSHNEGLPVSILEAMSWALPVIATRVGGIPELVRDGIDGLLVDAGDVDALATAIAMLAKHPDRCRSMGLAARERVSTHYSAEAVLPILFQAYDEMLSAPRVRDTQRSSPQPPDGSHQ